MSNTHNSPEHGGETGARGDNRGFRRRPNRSSSPGGGNSTSVLGSMWAFVRELVIIVVFALIISFIVKTWLLQSFYIPSGSMRNTLIEDDRVVVSKLTPDLFDIKRGDIVVFEDPGGWLPPSMPRPRSGVAKVLSWVGVLPEDEGNHLIKRVVGLPGDHVECCTADGKLTVNGQPIDEPYVFPGTPPSSVTFNITVPPGKLWVMGDNRDHSSDSRFHDKPSSNGTEGSVPIANVVGRAFAVIWPLNRATWLSDYPQVFSKVPNASQNPSKRSSAVKEEKGSHSAPLGTGSTPHASAVR
ncbi:signal peptidase I [Dermatophilus congolensis]|nr:signal peptidase I [Dermatophilus congolensis]MBO3128842.1 signal peptidase I [Dermatophilus congolensis]MBO3132520.1 signal peptidase I [Dermatophilus congolensis]MBO3133319.1 signal peptidase I [Dermatophilus congolensis]MBO3135554.1 signal peptidase I [Dermatophilus congolensis]MBO3137793.1 signal peptidase I [Dermatophilus congolensis]